MNMFSLFGGPTSNPHVETVPISVVECLGREHSGKSALKAMLFKLTQAGPLPSGLDLNTHDPKTLIRFMNGAIQTYRSLQTQGMISTIEPEMIEYTLFDADRPCARLQLRDSIGQLLTYDSAENEKRMEEQFAKHHENLAKASVIQVFLSCPTDDRPETIERLQNDLTVLMPNLRKVLSSRPLNRKVGIALVLTKTDAAFRTAEEAKSALTDDRLRGMMHRLVHLVEHSDRVGLAAIIPVSAFGYGQARLLDQDEHQSSGAPQKGFSLLSQGEAEWVLKAGVQPQPHNLNTLVWFSLMAGIALKSADQYAETNVKTAKLLSEDIKALQGWLVPLQCRQRSN